MATVTATAENFEELVTSSGTVFFDFWASWCGPCRTFAPIFEEAADRHPDLVFAKIDTEAEQELAASFQIMSIPTLMVVRDGIAIFSQAGALPAPAFEDLIEQVRAVDMDDVRRQIAEEPDPAGPAPEG